MLLSSFKMTLVLNLLSAEVSVTHCCSHNLNLSLSSSCKNPEIDNVLNTYKAITILFNRSPKREGSLEHILKSRSIGAEKRKVLVGMCKIRTSERDISYEYFYLAISFMLEAFEIMIQKTMISTVFTKIAGIPKLRKTLQAT